MSTNTIKTFTFNNVPPSQLGAFPTDLVLEWTLLLIIIALLAYTARTISREKTTYVQEAVSLTFDGFILLIPKWWHPSIQEAQLLHFYRADTHYDWYAEFCMIEASPQTLLHQYVQAYWKNADIIFDEDVIKTTQADYVLKNVDLVAQIQSFIRLEGTATEKEIERIYLDSCWIQLKRNPSQIYHFYSLSSVLSGSIEGPYFEEILKNLAMKNS